MDVYSWAGQLGRAAHDHYACGTVDLLSGWVTTEAGEANTAVHVFSHSLNIY